jgi:hypothetical protein
MARLDFFLITENILSNLKNCKVEPSYRSDHSMIILELEFNPFIRGKGLWKFNNSLLYDIDYINMVKEKKLDVKNQYSALVYNFDEMDNVSNEDIHFTINSQLLLETLLMEICGNTITYSSYKKRENEKQEKKLRNEIAQMEVNINESQIPELENKKQELENYRKNKVKGKMVRSRAKWIDEGEKPTNYFCGLESKIFTSKIILVTKVEKEDGTIINKILNFK